MNVFEYPYLVMSIWLLIASLVGCLMYKGRRKALLISGLFSMPCCLTTVFFVPEYWNPDRVLDFFLGIEDILFSFSTGIIAFLYMAICCPHAGKNARISGMIKNYLKLWCLGIVVIAVMRQLPLMVMNQALIGMMLIGVLLCLKRRWLVVPAFVSGIFFTFFYTMVLAASFYFFPSFENQWNHANLSGKTIFGFPIEESLWAFIFGTCWVIVMAHVMGIESESKRAHTQNLDQASTLETTR